MQRAEFSTVYGMLAGPTRKLQKFYMRGVRIISRVNPSGEELPQGELYHTILRDAHKAQAPNT